ncbi:hypothetical protein Mapa_000516 [Marchantia paleacea]|nr:hypothetical protein Mapa_000516 [Marchantia paleacea]
MVHFEFPSLALSASPVRSNPPPLTHFLLHLKVLSISRSLSLSFSFMPASFSWNSCPTLIQKYNITVHFHRLASNPPHLRLKLRLMEDFDFTNHPSAATPS